MNFLFYNKLVENFFSLTEVTKPYVSGGCIFHHGFSKARVGYGGASNILETKKENMQ
jgi:hypothetical protein